MPPPINTTPFALIEGPEEKDPRDYRYFSLLSKELLNDETISESNASIEQVNSLKEKIIHFVKNQINYPQNKYLDLTSNLPKIRDQKRFGSCAAHTSACVREWQQTVDYNLSKPLSLSPQFIYEFRKGARGMNSRNVMKILQNEGIVEEVFWKYRGDVKPEEMSSQEPATEKEVAKQEKQRGIPKELLELAKNFRIKSYWAINGNTLNASIVSSVCHQIMYALITEGPVYIGVDVYHKGSKQTPPANHNRIWAPDVAGGFTDKLGVDGSSGHAMTIVGFKDLDINSQGDVSGNFVIRNSWGSRWGDNIGSNNELFGYPGKGYVEMPFSDITNFSDSNRGVWVCSDIENTVSLAPENEVEAFDYYYGALKYYSDLRNGSNSIPLNPNIENVYLLGIRGWGNGRIAPKIEGEFHDSIVAMWIDSNQIKHCREFTARTSSVQIRGKKGTPWLVEGVHIYTFEPKNVSWSNSDFTIPSVSVTNNLKKFYLIPANTIEYVDQLPNGEKGDVVKKGKHLSIKSEKNSQPGDQAIKDAQFDDFVTILVDNHLATVEVEKDKILSKWEKTLNDSNYDFKNPPNSINIPAEITYTLITNAELLDYWEGGN
ncbi:MAG: C1 family peptidase [Candidatus Poseidoniales archaeon]